MKNKKSFLISQWASLVSFSAILIAFTLVAIINIDTQRNHLLVCIILSLGLIFELISLNSKIHNERIYEERLKHKEKECQLFEQQIFTMKSNDASAIKVKKTSGIKLSSQENEDGPQTICHKFPFHQGNETLNGILKSGVVSQWKLFGENSDESWTLELARPASETYEELFNKIQATKFNDYEELYRLLNAKS